ncbi:MAG: hypothetical protein HFG77_03550 [Hungatella sp.]|nr:hypothetical protein [Hungatella sp.]
MYGVKVSCVDINTFSAFGPLKASQGCLIITTSFGRGHFIQSGNSIDRKQYNQQCQKSKEAGIYRKNVPCGTGSADLAVERVADRVKVGGHGIKEKDIRKRYESSLQNLQTAIQLCDEVYVYDNIVSFRQVAIFKEGVRIMDNELSGWLEYVLAE